MSEVLERKEVELDRLVGTRSIAFMLDLSATHVRDKLTKRTEFPKPVWVGGVRRWKLSEVNKWIKDQQS